MMDYRPTAVFGWFAIRDGHMKSADIGLVVGTAMLVKVERVTHSLYWLGALGRLGYIRGEIWFGCYKKK